MEVKQSVELSSCIDFRGKQAAAIREVLKNGLWRIVFVVHGTGERIYPIEAF